jgi:glutamyl-tRNA reductase
VREREVAAALRRLGHLSPADREAVEHLSRALMNKFLHAPSVRLRAAAANGRGLGVVDAARYLFALGEATEARAREASDEPPHEDTHA